MEIKIQIKGRVFSLSIGRKTEWFEQIYFIMLIEEFYNKYKEIEYATVVFKLFNECKHS